MLRNIVAIRRDGFDVNVFTFIVDVPNAYFDLESAVKAATIDYLKTPEGRRVFERNCCEMNWADFCFYVPNSFCEKHGFKKVKTDVLPNIIVNWDEELVDESQVFGDEDFESEGR